MASDGDFRVVLIDSARQWERYQDRWDRLADRVTDATAFQRFRFLRTWWRHFGADKRLYIVVAEKGGRLCGALPLQIAERRKLGRRYRVLEFIGMPDELDRPRLLVPGDSDALWAALMEGLSRDDRAWDLIQLDELENGGAEIARLSRWARNRGLWHWITPLHPVPYLEKTGGFEDYLAGRSRKLRKSLRNSRNRAQRELGIRYEEADDPDAVTRLLDVFFRIERASWKAAEQRDVGRIAAYPAFYRELLTGTPEFQPHAIVQYLGGEPSAATFGFRQGGEYYALQIAHDHRFDRYSPGTLLESFEMERFFANPELRRYEFLGGSGFNKRRWTATASATSTFRAYRPGPWTALGTAAKFYLLPAGRALFGNRPGKRPDHPAPFEIERATPPDR